MKRLFQVWLIGVGIAFSGACHRSTKPPADPSENPPAPLFTEITAAVGFDDSPEPWPDGTNLTPEINPGGIALFDYDGDGDLDLLQTTHPRPGPDALRTPAPKCLFRQNDRGVFERIADAGGLDDTGYGQGVAVGDIDNDGSLDVYFCNFGRDRLYRNRGDGTFEDVTGKANINHVGEGGAENWSTCASFFDYDRDGFLDLFVVDYCQFDPTLKCDNDGVPTYCGPAKFKPALDTLYHNNGDGTFTDVTDAAGIDTPGKGLGVLCADLTGDGWIDVFVANDGEANQLWVNRRDGTFADEAMLRGCGVNGAGQPEANMGVTVGDVNSDGLLDLFITHERNEKNTLFLADANGYYADKSSAAGMAAIDLPYTGWGTGFFDYDHDGDLDVAVVNGRISPHEGKPGAKLGEFWNRYALDNLLFENDGAGKFRNASSRAGGFTKHVEVGRGLAFGDLDNDGDLDLVVQNVDNTIRIFRNDCEKRGAHWLAVRAMTNGRDAIGAEVRLTAGDRKLVRVVMAGYSSASSNDPRVHFGLGEHKPASLEISWPDGALESFAVPSADRILIIQEGTGRRRE